MGESNKPKESIVERVAREGQVDRIRANPLLRQQTANENQQTTTKEKR